MFLLFRDYVVVYDIRYFQIHQRKVSISRNFHVCARQYLLNINYEVLFVRLKIFVTVEAPIHVY